MGFLQRLGWYLVGLSIGIIFLVFFLKKKSDETDTQFCYLPNCRVLKDMRSKPLVFGEVLDEKFRDTLLVKSFLKAGNIDFGKSDTKSAPCKKYTVKIVIGKVDYTLTAENCVNKVIINNIFQSND